MRANNREDSDTQPLNRDGEIINKTKDQTADDLNDSTVRRKKTIKYSIIGGVVLVVVVLAIVLPIVLLNKKDDNNPPEPNPPKPPIPSGDNPYTVDTNTIVDHQISVKGQLNFQTKLSSKMNLLTSSAVAEDQPVGFNWTQNIQVCQYNQIASTLNFNFEALDYKVSRFVLTNASDEKPSFSIPDDIIAKPTSEPYVRLEMLGFSINYNPFSFRFQDVTNNNTLITTEGQSLVMMDKFIQMDFLLPSQRLYGLGERVHEFQLNEGTWTMWAQGQDSPYDDGQGRKNLYGVHPFVLVQTGTVGDYIGIFFRNSNAQSPVVAYRSDGQTTLSYITIGGQLEVYFFLHGTAKEMIREYQNMFGKPQLPPFWSLGWQQASWKYQNLTMVQDMIDQYYQNDMPLEVVYFDIPYMDNYADFTVDQVNFKGLPEFTAQLKQNNQKLVVIVDAAISADDTTNKYYVMGNTSKAFIQSGIAQPGQNGRNPDFGMNLISQVWPQKSVFMDWFGQPAVDLWSTGLDDLYQLVNYDGLWLDMSEATSFQNGETDTGLPTPKAEQHKVSRQLSEGLSNGWFVSYQSQSYADTYNVPFLVLGSTPQFAGNWDNMTLSLNATHPSLNNELEYNVHSLYGHMMARRTQEYLHQKNDYRQFLLTRSTFATSGRYTSHWLGDNWRDWAYLRHSISGIMNMNMFGIPHVGADVCGFFGEKKDDEMCLRWIQLSTFYTMARAHQNLTWNDQPSERTEPYLLDTDYRNQAREALYDRYSYLRMMYTCLFEANQMAQTCFDPLFFHYPNDPNTYNNVEDTFIAAGAVKVSPILDQIGNATSYSSYFPKGRWVNLADMEDIVDAGDSGKTVQLTPRSKVNAYLRPGSLIPYQNNTVNKINNTNTLLQAPINLVVNRNSKGDEASNFAVGTLLLDQGTNRSEIDNYQYEYYEIRHQASGLLFRLAGGTLGSQNHILGNILITDAKDLDQVDLVCAIGWDNEPLGVKFAPTQMLGSTLLIQLAQRVKFNQFKAIYYGSSQDPKYINFCDPTTTSYVLKEGEKWFDLNTTSTTAILTNMGSALPDISMTLQIFDEGIVNVRWTWASQPNGKRTPRDLPQDIINTDPRAVPQGLVLSKYITLSDPTAPFQVNFRSVNTNDKVPLLTLRGLLFDEFVNRMELQLNTPKDTNFTGIFGLGERSNTHFFYPDGVYTTYASDHGTPDEDGKAPSKAMYGVHPFFVYQHADASWVGVFSKVMQATDYWVKNYQSQGQITVKSTAIGGIGDLYVFIDRQTPESVVSQYYKVIGQPVLVPQWALGWNHCKWGYKTAEQFLESVQNYTDNQLPLDAQWSDIDYMQIYRDFTYDPKNFGNLPSVVDEIHKLNVKFVPIVDFGISIRPGSYGVYDSGHAQGVFLQINNGEEFIGRVWPNEAAFPDFFNPKTAPWWQSQISSMYDKVKFDGLWLDMNEISNFCDGICSVNQFQDNPIQNLLPYIPGGINLETHAVSLDANHSNGFYQVDTHSYMGSMEVKATNDWFKSQEKRTFIIERSSVAGMGKFGSRWLGDNESKERHMGYSVSGIMLMNMFGIPLAGVDICGFGGDTTPELCARWHVVGSYYPFSRNHNAIKSIPQEPYLFTGEYEAGRTFLSIMRDAINNKYKLVRYYYTNLFLMSVSTDPQKPFYKPVFFSFPEDRNTYTNITYNVMLGDSLKLSVNSDTLGQNTSFFYMPAGTWCSPLNPSLLCITNEAGKTYEWPSKAYDSYLHQREGTVVPFQEVPNVQTTNDLKNKPVDFHVVGTVNDPDTMSWSAAGTYVNDDGDTLDVTGNYNQYLFQVRRSGTAQTEKILFTTNLAVGATNMQLVNNCYKVNENDMLGTIYIYVAARYTPATTYTVTGQDQNRQDLGFKETATYDAATDRIVFTPINSRCLSSVFTYVFVPAN